MSIRIGTALPGMAASARHPRSISGPYGGDWARETRVSPTVEEAVNLVFAAAGEDFWLERAGIDGTNPETLARVAARAGLSANEANHLPTYLHSLGGVSGCRSPVRG